MKTSSKSSQIAEAFFARKKDVEQWVGRELYSPCFEVQAVSTNGAGDRTIAGFLAAIVRDAEPATALQTAVAVGAASVERPDAASEMVSLKEIQERIERGWNRRQTEYRFGPYYSTAECGCLQGKHDRRATELPVR
jgi:hypothetical protein